MRHLAITKLAESEVSEQTILSLSGHVNRSMLEHYTHTSDAAKRKRSSPFPPTPPPTKPLL
jgi:hypothetical protein